MRLPKPDGYHVGAYVVVDGLVYERDVVDGVARWRCIARYERTSGLLRRKLERATQDAARKDGP